MLSLLKDYPFILHGPLQAALVVGAVCAFLGVHVVLRRVVFVGAALAQVSSAGVGLALLTGSNPSLLSLLLTLVGVAAFSVKSKDKRTTQESFIGIGYAVASAVAVLFVAKSAQGEGHMLDVLSGNILTVSASEIWQMGIIGLIAIGLHMLFQKQFLYSAFDPETAQSSGVKAGRWDLFFFLILGIVIAMSIKLAGTLLVFAFLVLPAVTALLFSQRLGKIHAIAVGSAVVATVLGLYASVKFDMPSGPTIVAFSFAIFAVAWVISRFR